jgi:hypothetical protein
MDFYHPLATTEHKLIITFAAQKLVLAFMTILDVMYMRIRVRQWPIISIGNEGIDEKVYTEISSDNSDAEANDSPQTSDSDKVHFCSVSLCFDRYSQKYYHTIF